MKQSTNTSFAIKHERITAVGLRPDIKTTLKFFRNIPYMILMGLLLNSCINHKNVIMLREDDKSRFTFDIENPRETSYTIQTGDQLYIKVYSLDPKTSKFFQSDLPNLMNPTYLYLNSYTVDEQGYISFSFIDSFSVKGLTIQQAQKRIQELLKEYFTEISVVVKLVNFQVTLMGEVRSPGTFTIQREYANIIQAISLAGDITPFANINRVKLIRHTPSGSMVKIIDLSDINLLAKDYYHLMPNDILYFESRPIKSYTWREVPYSLALSVISTAVVIYSVFLK